MIMVTALDGIASLGYLAGGEVTLRTLITVVVLPPLCIAALASLHPRRVTGCPTEPEPARMTSTPAPIR